MAFFSWIFRRSGGFFVDFSWSSGFLVESVDFSWIFHGTGGLFMDVSLNWRAFHGFFVELVDFS